MTSVQVHRVAQQVGITFLQPFDVALVNPDELEFTGPRGSYRVRCFQGGMTVRSFPFLPVNPSVVPADTLYWALQWAVHCR